MNTYKTWTTKDGTVLNIADMSTSHIKNCIAMLKRNGYVAPSTVSFYCHCPLPRGEMAQDAFEQEFMSILNKPVAIEIDWLEDELQQRADQPHSR